MDVVWRLDERNQRLEERWALQHHLSWEVTEQRVLQLHAGVDSLLRHLTIEAHGQVGQQHLVLRA
jgi:hypothetical protein